ncbi:MAG TPA: methyl-accepting chemotaxis protein [Gammaproteobacteria bacterium]|nr:methyl-accepting chemotaxis protein [Gammaproteobacteria bacterium]
MKKFKSLNIRQKVLASTLLLTIIMLTASTMIFRNSQHLATAADDLTDKYLPLMNLAHDLKLDIVQVQQWLTDISATRGRDGLDDGFEQAEAYARKFREDLAKIRHLAPEMNIQESGVEKEFEDYYSAGRKMAQAYVQGGPAAGNAMMSAFDETAETLGATVDELLGRIMALGLKKAEEEKVLTHQMRWTLIISSLVLSLSLAAIIWHVSQRLKALIGIMPEVSRIGEGDLSQPLISNQLDEVGLIAQAMEAMRSKMSSSIRQFKQGAKLLMGNTGELDKNAEEAFTGAQTQRNATHKLSATAEQMAVSAKEIAGNISIVASASEDTHQQTYAGQETIQEAASRLNSLAQQIGETSKTIQELERHSDAIAGILDVIQGIAEQTNLLALNAAIEAARAGEQGRGFAVVADEVRTLAGRTQSSTEEIQEKISKLLEGVGKAVQSMSSSARLADETLQKANGANQAFESIVGLVSQISEQSTAIAHHAREQDEVAQMIVSDIGSIRQSAEKTADSMTSAKELVGQMRDQVIKINEISGQFKTE